MMGLDLKMQEKDDGVVYFMGTIDAKKVKNETNNTKYEEFKIDFTQILKEFNLELYEPQKVKILILGDRDIKYA